MTPIGKSGMAAGHDDMLARMKRAVRKAERRAGDGNAIGGTGATILKFLPPPLTRLLEKKRIGAEELRAADDITIAFYAQAGALMLKPPSLEKRDATYNGREPVFVIDAIRRYKRWSQHWSERARCGDRTLEIVIAAVIDERALHIIERDVGIRHGVAAKAVIAALRDYAARAGWMDRRTADSWIAAAEATFPLRSTKRRPGTKSKSGKDIAKPGALDSGVAAGPAAASRPGLYDPACHGRRIGE
jgi:hypothetical protein